MIDLRQEVAAAISKVRFAAAPHELNVPAKYLLDQEVDAVMCVVGPLAGARPDVDRKTLATIAHGPQVPLHPIENIPSAWQAVEQAVDRLISAGAVVQPPHVDREALLDVLTTADEDLHNEHGGAGALMNRNYLEYLADRLIAAGAIAGTP